jgi:DNA-binding MarR family transcriptional regulator
MTILQALSRTGEISQGRLGHILAMDSTSLTRTIAIMSREGWITERRGEDRRERRLRLSDAGEKQLKRALPAWEKVQSRLRHQLGNENWNNLMQLSRQLASFTTTEGELR